MNINDRLHGFVVKKIDDLGEYRSTGIWLEHEKSGCQVYHVRNDDSENLFSFTFRTPAADGTGVPHIIEHSVLSGSRVYPIKDPFINLIKGSMQTFLNAMTYPDKTVYPGSSVLEKDYFNLFEVYGDAVFFPLLRHEVFLQEGRRFEPDGGSFKVTGIVYNEMKGAYSTHDSIVGEWAYRSLFPDSPYYHDSGGDPLEIPSLTYERFVDYHRTYYHPSNCLVFLYGNIPTERNLEFLDGEFLSRFSRQTADISIPDQPRWSKPRRLERTGPLAEGEDPAGKTTVIVNWLTVGVADPFEVLGMEVLSEILIGNSGSPLQKVIVESRLGEDLSPQSGVDTEIKEIVFSLGVRGTDPEKTGAFEDLVLGELARLSAEGISADVVEGALKRVEFLTREIKGGIPFGLRLMGKSLRGWLHGSEPSATIEFTRWMEELKREVRAGGFFERLIRERLLDNPHRTTLVVRPDADHERLLEEAIDRDLAERLGSLTVDERSAMEEADRRLREFQDAPDSPEDLRKIPSLTREDIPREIERIDSAVLELPVPAYSHDFYTNGVAYLDFAFDTAGLPEDLVPLIPLYCKALSGCGLPGVPYDEVARLLSIHTGGFYAYPEIGAVAGSSEVSGEYLFVRMKCLVADIAEAMGLAGRLITRADLDDPDRLTDLILELRNDYRAAVIPSGHSLVALRSASRLSPILHREDLWRGTGQFLYVSRLAEQLDTALPEFAASLSAVRDVLTCRSRLTVGLTAEDGDISTVREVLAGWIDSLPAGKPAVGTPLAPADRTGGIEALIAPAQVGYVGAALPCATADTPEHAHEVILAHILRTEHLWERIRMKGGAYGASASANGGEGVFSFSSYRDPNIVETLDAFAESLDEIAAEGIDDDTLEKAVIGVVGHDVRPLSPGQKGVVAFRRRLYGITDELRQRKRDALVASGVDDIRRAAARLGKGWKSGTAAVLAGRQAVEAAALRRKEIGDPTLILPL